MKVTAPCRLHFGLFHVPVEGLDRWPDGKSLRKFGGLGMMISNPSVTADARYARGEFVLSGSLAHRFGPRVLRLARHQYAEVNGPAEHVGLGVGTAAVMALGHAVLGRYGLDYAPKVFERGQRSGVGIHGARLGGFIVDDGKLGDELPALRERIEVPSEWRVVLTRPPVPGAWHGEAERTAFRRQRSAAEALDTTSRLLRLANEFIIPALKRAEFDTFAATLTDFNRIAGEPFNDDQGGPYAGPAVAGIIDELISWGVLGVGQSSWGPTVFAFASSEDEANALAGRLRDRFPNLADLRVTAADNQGVRVLTDDEPG